MQTMKRSGMAKAAGVTAGRVLTAGPRRTTDRITARDMREFDARVDRALERLNQISANLERIGRK